MFIFVHIILESYFVLLKTTFFREYTKYSRKIMTLSGEVSEGEAQYMYYVFKNKSLFTNNNQNKKIYCNVIYGPEL